MNIIFFVFLTIVLFQILLIYKLIKLLNWLTDKDSLINNLNDAIKQEILTFRETIQNINYCIENPSKPTIQPSQILFLVIESSLSWHYSKKIPVKKLINFFVKNYKKILPLLLKI